MIYLDNSATSFPKPKCVIDAVNDSMMRYGNYGRSSYDMALKTTEKIYKVISIRNDKNGFPHFLIYEKNSWIWKSAKYFELIN